MGYLGAIPFALKNALLIVINTKPGKGADFCAPQHVYGFTGNQTLHIGAIGSSGTVWGYAPQGKVYIEDSRNNIRCRMLIDTRNLIQVVTGIDN